MPLYIHFLEAMRAAKAMALPLLAISSTLPDIIMPSPAPYMVVEGTDHLNLINLDTPLGRAHVAEKIGTVPLYRMTIELALDGMLWDAQKTDDTRAQLKKIFAPEEPPEPVIDVVAEKYAFSGVLRFPLLASRTDAQLLDQYLKLYSPLCKFFGQPADYVMAMFGGHPEHMLAQSDGFMWQGQGFVRTQSVISQCVRMDTAPDIGFEEMVLRGKQAAQSLAFSQGREILAAWIGAEGVQTMLCRDIDAALSDNIKPLPRWVRSDMFRILEREAMKQVFAEQLVKAGTDIDWRSQRFLADSIEANAKGEVNPLLQQLMGQTISVDAHYAGSAQSFVLQAERRAHEAQLILTN